MSRRKFEVEGRRRRVATCYWRGNGKRHEQDLRVNFVRIKNFVESTPLY